ncbi:hypothetical protein FGE12_07325 [Aggregicoccus sp. 17bor-14]|uniref:hypothetical protein n=1 Tax=Myxococcaceae TaxID=31 RepID=UPI00129C57A3|nr:MULTISPECIES: hypothetical protein [Myxococcaceae]MBF5042203.1 hypothetical protein [Simulacricoccus sp. 17bor-14]MRI87979.1 hypothetical protein [Aggregicoccus sp. 17bor-14]
MSARTSVASLVASLALLLGACGTRQHTDARDASSSEGGSGAPAPALTRTLADGGTPPSSAELAGLEAGAPRPEGEAPTARPEAAAPHGASAPHLPQVPAGAFAGVLLPPSTVGKANVAFAGCLAEPTASAEAGSRFPPPAAAPTRRGAAEPAVQVSALGTGALVTHQLTHGCCLQGRVSSAIEGRTLTLTETLSGESCRCLCSSTVRAAVRLEPGQYTLKVVTREGAKSTSSKVAGKVAYEGPLQVR